MTLPALFLSHGAPTLAIDPSPARDFLRGLGAMLPRPRAILVVSAHHDQPRAAITAAPNPPTIHDFGDFGEELRRMRYPAPGDPDLARAIADRLAAAGFPTALDPARGFDHGAWVPLSLAYPAADVTLIQLSIDSTASPETLFRLGQALAPLRDEGVLIIASGSLTHDLHAVRALGFDPVAPTPDWVSAFADWIEARMAAGDTAALLAARDRAPFGRRNHPTPEHLQPLFVAMGAGGGAGASRPLHRSTTYGVLAMDAYAFG